MKIPHAIKTKWALKFTVRPGYSMCSHRKVRELIFKTYFKIILVSKT